MRDVNTNSTPGNYLSLNGLGNRIGAAISRREVVYLLLIMVIFDVSAIYQDLAHPMWFDEFFTFFISRLASLSEMLLVMPCDGQPPLQYLLTRLSLRLFGFSELSLRLPELLAYNAVGFLTYRIVRRHGSAVQALFACALILSASATKEALWARPYGLLLAFTAATYLAWQTAATTQYRRLLPLSMLSLAVAGAILSHHFGVIHVGLLLIAGEVTRFAQRRRIDAGMLVAIACGLAPLVLTVPLARQSSQLLGSAVRNSTNFWAKPSAGDLWQYLTMTSFWLLIPTILLLPLLRAERPAHHHVDPPEVPAHEWAAACVLSLLLPVQLLLASATTGYFLHRYAIGTSLGLALLLSWGLPRIQAMKQSADAAFSLGMLILFLITVHALSVDWSSQANWPPNLMAKAVPAELLNAPAELPIVVASAFDYAPTWWYSPPALQKRLTYLSDVPYAVKRRQFLEELSLVDAQAYIPIKVVSYTTFLKAHQTFLLYCVGSPNLEWVKPRLASEGWHFNLISSSGKAELIRVSAETPAGLSGSYQNPVVVPR